MVLGNAVSQLETVCMDFEPRLKVHNLVSLQPKSIKLGQATNHTVIFHMVVSVYWLVKIWSSLQFAAQLRNGQMCKENVIIMNLFL